MLKLFADERLDFAATGLGLKLFETLLNTGQPLKQFDNKASSDMQKAIAD